MEYAWREGRGGKEGGGGEDSRGLAELSWEDTRADAPASWMVRAAFQGVLGPELEGRGRTV